MNQTALNIATILVSVAAVVMVGIRVRQEFFLKPNAGGQPKAITEWQVFALGGRHRVGPSSAAVTIVEFADFQCPFCKQAAGDLRDIRARFPGTVAIVFRHFPLQAHPFAIAAAEASECAARQGRFERYEQLLFDSQDALGRKPWKEFAQEAGVPNIAEFEACLSDPAIRALVDQDAAAGKRLGVTGTPTFLINNLEVTGYPGRGRFEELVRSAIGARPAGVAH